MVSEVSIAARVGPENSLSRPRSMVTLATIDTSTAGNTAMTENRLTIWTCSRAAARARLHHRPGLAADDPDQYQDGRAVDQHEGNDNFACRFDRGQAGEHHEGEKCGYQGQADRKRRQ